MKRGSGWLCVVGLLLLGVGLGWAGGQKAVAGEGQKVTIMWYGGYGYEPMVEKYTPVFEGKNPGIKLDSVFVPYQQMREKLTLALSEETGEYDIVHSGTGWEAPYYKFFENLQPYIDREKYDLKDFMPVMIASIGVLFSETGDRYGFPYRANTISLWYRKDIMDQLGMNPVQWEGVPGWQQYLSACEKLKGNKQLVYPSVVSGFYMVPIVMFPAVYLPTGNLYFNQKGEPQFNNKAGLQSLEILKKLYGYGPPGASALERPEAAQIFLAGDTALHITWPQYITTQLEDPNASKVAGKWKATSTPGPGNIGSNGIYMVKASKNKEAAWEVMKWLVSKEMMGQAMISTGTAHTRISSYGIPGVKEVIPDLDAQLVSLMRAFMLGMNTFPAGATWIHEAGKYLVEYIWGDKSAQETLDRVEQGWYKHNKDAIGKAKWLTYYEQHNLQPPNWKPSEEAIRRALRVIK